MLFGNSDQVTRAIGKSISDVCLHTPQRHRSVIIDLCPAGTRCLSLPWFSCLEKLTTLAVVGSRWMSDNESQEDSTDGRPPPLLNGDDSSSSSESGTSCSINHEIVLEKAEELYANGGCELLPRVLDEDDEPNQALLLASQTGKSLVMWLVGALRQGITLVVRCANSSYASERTAEQTTYK
jgi:hypothetical protein